MISTTSPILTEVSTFDLLIEDLPISNAIPTGLQDPFEAPHLIVPIDKADPKKVIGNSYSAQLSTAMSTVFVFDVPPEHQGKSCDLALFMPPPFPFTDLAPAKIRSPGGISVSRLGNQMILADMSASSVDAYPAVGSVPLIQEGNQYNVANLPCEAGQKVAYQVDSIGGLAMDFFQMTSPPLGLFMLVVG